MRRLDEMVAWSRRHSSHPVVMSWGWITENGVTVDLFDFPDLRDQYHVSLAPPPEVEPVKVFEPYRPSLPERREGLERNNQTPRRKFDVDPIDPRALFEAAARGAERLIADLYTTAPAGPLGQDLFDRPVRGDWVPIDVFGSAGKQLFLGVLAERPDPAELDRVARRQGEQSTETDSDHDLQTTMVDRLVIAIADRPTEPTWTELRAALE